MSDMFTTCPNCRLNLAVTPVDLRVGQGYVRCGRCDRVFNALVSLAEDVARDQQSGHVATGTTTVPALEEQPVSPRAVIELLAPEPEVESDPEPEPEAWLELPPEPEPAATPAAAEPEEWSKVTPLATRLAEQVDVVEQLATGTFETIVLEGDGFLQTEEHVDEEDVEAQLQRIADQIDDDAQEAEEVVIEYTDDPSPEEPEPDVDLVLGNAPPVHWAWKAGAALLALLLAAQVVHHHRQSLVAQSWAEGPLRAVYGLFGAGLEPRWDLSAYDLRQLGGEALPGAAARIMLRATVQNRASTSQPPPMIRVTLQDRFGNALTTAAVPPQDYLHGAVPARMRADQRLDAELTLDDPNRQAVGFELDACLPDSRGQLHCSNGP